MRGDFLQEKLKILVNESKEKQYGIRLHKPKDLELVTYLEESGFEIFNLGKISFLDFLRLSKPIFHEYDISPPINLIGQAYNHFDQLGKSLRYIGEGFKMNFELKRMPTHEEICQVLKRNYCLFAD